MKNPEGTRRIGPPFPTKSNTKSHKSISKSYSKEKNGGERHRGSGLGGTEQSTDKIQKPP